MGDDEEALGSVLEPCRVRKLDLLILGVDFIRKSAELVEDTLANLEQMLCMHANFLSEQEEFADAVRLEIESLTKED